MRLGKLFFNNYIAIQTFFLRLVAILDGFPLPLRMNNVMGMTYCIY